MTDNATLYTEKQKAAQDSRLLAAGKQPKGYRLIKNQLMTLVSLLRGLRRIYAMARQGCLVCEYAKNKQRSFLRH